MTLSRQEAHDVKIATTAEELLPAIRERWSPRSFTEREVGPAELKALFEAARWAPSSGNGQPWRFVVGVKGTETHAKIAATLAGFNKDWRRRPRC